MARLVVIFLLGVVVGVIGFVTLSILIADGHNKKHNKNYNKNGDITKT